MHTIIHQNASKQTHAAQTATARPLWLRTGFWLALLCPLIAYSDSSPISVGDATATVINANPLTLNFPVSRSGDLGYDAYLPFNTVNDSAIAGIHYAAASGLLKLPAGEASVDLPATILGSAANQPSAQFKVEFGAALGMGPTPSFQPAASPAIGGAIGPQSVTVADFNLDGKPDLATVNVSSETITVLLNDTTSGSNTPVLGLATLTAFAPYAIASADLNRDGRPDLVIAQAGENSVTVFLNTTAPGAATPTFTAAQTFATPAQTYAVTTVDINGDGALDIVAAQFLTGTLSVLFNTSLPGAASASFAAAQSFASGDDPLSGPISVASADIDGDGLPDLIAANFDADTVSVLINRTVRGSNSGNFVAATSFTSGTSPRAVTAADINGDGRPDLIVANAIGAGTVSVLINTSAAGAAVPSFAPATPFTVGAIPAAVHVVDINGDGRPDLLSANEAGNSISVLLNLTARDATVSRFNAAQTVLVGSAPRALASLDLNGDGALDLVVANASSNTLSLLLNTTPASTAVPNFYSPILTRPTTGAPTWIASADLNGDGKQELLITNGGNGENSLSIMSLSTSAAGHGTPSLVASRQDFPSCTLPSSIAAADINGDGRPDLLVTCVGAIVVNLNTTPPGSASFSFSSSTVYSGSGRPRQIRAVDFNSDGCPDLLVADINDGNAWVLLNTTAPGAASASFSAPQIFDNAPVGTADASAVAAADVNGDGRPDLLITNGFDNYVAVRLNTTAPGAASASFAAAAKFATGLAPDSTVSASDLNGDGKPELIVVSRNIGSVSILRNITATGALVPSFAAAQNVSVHAQPYGLAVNDIDGDGRSDLMVGSFLGSTLSLLRNTTVAGAETFSFDTPRSYEVGSSARWLVSADLNGDGMPDLANANFGDNTVSILLNSRYQAIAPAAAATGFINYNVASVTASVSPAVVDFGAQVVGSFSAPRTITVTNTGTDPLIISNNFFSGANVADFSPGNDTCSNTTLNVNASCSILVLAYPQAAGNRSAMLTINSNAANSPYVVSLLTNAAARSLSYGGAGSLDFGNQPVASTSIVHSVSLVNLGNVPFTINSVVAGGANPTDFALDSNTCTAPVAPAANCTLNYTFTPGAAGARSSTLTLTAVDPATSATLVGTLTVSGIGTQAVASLTPSSFNFGSIPLGSSSLAQTFILKNTGNAALTVVGAALPANFPADGNDCPALLAVNAECSFSLRFVPDAAGLNSGTLNIFTNIGDTTASLSGIGTVPNQAPVVTTSGGSASYAGSPVVIDAGIVVSDVDNATLARAVVVVFSGLQASEDLLSYANDGATMGNISGSYDAATGVLGLSSAAATATLAQWQSALRSVRYSNTAAVPDTSDRAIAFSVDDGALTSAGVSRTITLMVDTTPAAFSFTAAGGVEPSSVQTSNAITVSDINAPTSISVSGGSYSINGGAYTTAAGSVNAGDSVTLRQTAAANFATTLTTTLNIGGVSGDYAVTTRAALVAPAPISFTPVTGVARNATVSSNSVNVSGVEIAVAVTISGGSYSVNGGAYTSANGTVGNGDTLTVRQTSSPNFGTTTSAILTLGSGASAQSGSFDVTTLAAVTTPDAFAFGSRDGVALSSMQTSAAVIPTGINAPTSITITGGSYSIDGGAYTSAAGTLDPGSSVTVRVTASNQFSTATVAQLTIGGVQGSFTVTTLAADTTPEPFAFTALTGVARSSVQTSNTVTISGINTASPIRVSGGSYRINGGGYTTAAGSIQPGDTVTLRQTAAANFSITSTTVVTIGSGAGEVSGSFAVTTVAANPDPDAFTFGTVSGVAPGSVQTSGLITVAGTNTNSPVQVSNGSYAINGGAFTTAAGSVNAGDTVAVRTTASAAFSSTVVVTLRIGATQGTYGVTTLAADTTPDAFSFISVSGVGTGSVQSSNAIVVSGINTASAVSVNGGRYSVNGSAYTSTAATVNPGDSVSVQQTASASFSTTTQATLTIGGVSGSFAVTTQAIDTTPNPITIPAIDGAAPGTAVNSAVIEVSGTNAPTPISIIGGCVRIAGGACVGSGTLNPGGSFIITIDSSANYCAGATATVTVGGVPNSFTVTTTCALPPVAVKTGGGAFGGSLLALLAGLGLLRRARTRLRTLVLLGALAAIATPAQASDNHYAGIRLGQIRTNIDHALRSGLADAGYTGVQSMADDSSFGGTLYLGYAPIPEVDFELGYTRNGDVDARLSGTLPPSTSLVRLLQDVAGMAQGYGDTFSVSVRVPIRLGARFSVAPRAGILLTSTRVRVSLGNDRLEVNDKGGGYTLGTDLRYRIWRGLHLGGTVNYFSTGRTNDFVEYAAMLEWRW